MADDGREFYAERTDFDRPSCSAFVREAVLPELGLFLDRMFHEPISTRRFAGGSGNSMAVPSAWICDLLLDILDRVPDGCAAEIMRSAPQAAPVRSNLMAGLAADILAMHRQRTLASSSPNANPDAMAKNVKETPVMKGRRISFSGDKFGLERLLLRVRPGAPAFVVCRAGAPVAKLMPPLPSRRTAMKKRVRPRRSEFRR